MVRFSDDLNNKLASCIAKADGDSFLALSLISDALDSHGYYKLANKVDRYAQICAIAGVYDSIIVPTSPGQIMDIDERIEQVERGDWIVPEERKRMELEQMPMLRPNEFKLDPEYVKELRRQMREQKKKQNEMLDETSKQIDEDKWREADEEPKAEKPKEDEDLPTLSPRDFKWEPDYYKKVRKPELARERKMKLKNKKPKMSQELLDSLIVMADKFDAEGKFAMAAKIDDTLRSIARGRPKSPLKGLDEDTKKDLVKFLHNIGKRMSSSKNDLEELFRRMRYFDVAESAKPLGLDKAFKDMDRVQQCVDSGKESLHAMLGGNKSELRSLLEALEGDNAEDESEHNPMDFFNSREETETVPQEETEEGADLESDVETAEVMSMMGEEEESDEEYEEFEEADELLKDFWGDESFEGE